MSERATKTEEEEEEEERASSQRDRQRQEEQEQRSDDDDEDDERRAQSGDSRRSSSREFDSSDTTSSSSSSKKKRQTIVSLDREGRGETSLLLSNSSSIQRRRNKDILCCYSPHSVVLRFYCPVFTLCNIVKMISMSCKSQAEAFARSLETKLQFLDNHGLIMDVNDHVTSTTAASAVMDGGWSERSTAARDNVIEKFLSLAATSFPPRKCAQFDLLRAKYHSESDLITQEEELMLTKETLQKAMSHSVGNSNVINTNVNGDGEDDSNDSDLFFDFDIGSPDVEEQQLSTGGLCINPPFDIHDDFLDDLDEDDKQRRDSNDDGSDDAKVSTAYGSASSGLCSDLDGPPHIDDSPEEQGQQDQEQQPFFSFDPEESFEKTKQHSSSSLSSNSPTPIGHLSPASEESSNDDLLIWKRENHVPLTRTTDSQTEKKDRLMEGEGLRYEYEDNDTGLNMKVGEKGKKGLSVTSGDYKHTIANSKLNALIALLEKDKEYTRRSPPIEEEEEEVEQKSNDHGHRRRRRSAENNSPPRDDTSSYAIDICSSPTKRSSYKCPLPTISASPANFSFLSASVKEAPMIPYPQQGEKIERCISTPVLNSNERAFMESSPQMRRKFGVIEADLAELQVQKGWEDAKARADQEALVEAAPVTPVMAPPTTFEATLTTPEKLEGPLRRASSLKSGKTPPGTPGRRKIVRFADVFGLDLADVKTFLDEVPRIPKSAYKDLKISADLNGDLDSESSNNGSNGSLNISSSSSTASSSAHVSPAHLASSATSLVPMFNQPGGFPNFFDLLRDKKVCMENAFMVDHRSVKGTIRVQNVGFHKRVTVRYTVNEWISTADLEAEYIQGSCDGFSDKFTFVLTASAAPLHVGQRIQFCIRYIATDAEFWDNNDGKNYVFQCLSNNVGGNNNSNNNTSHHQHHPTIGSSSSSKPMSVMGGRSDGYSSGYSHSPSVMSEDPWLRYL